MRKVLIPAGAAIVLDTLIQSGFRMSNRFARLDVLTAKWHIRSIAIGARNPERSG